MNDARLYTVAMFLVTMITTIFHNIELTIGSSAGVIMFALWELCSEFKRKRIEIILKNKYYEDRIEL